VIESGSYVQQPVTGTARRLVSLWLYWTPDQPELKAPATPTPRRQQRPIKVERSKHLIKAGRLELKKEPATPLRAKRYRSGASISAPTSAAKRSGATVTRRARAVANESDTGESGGEGHQDRERVGGGLDGEGEPQGKDSLELPDIPELIKDTEHPT